MKYVRKKGRMHDHIQRTLAAKAAEMVRRKQYFLPKVGRSRYICIIVRIPPVWYCYVKTTKSHVGLAVRSQNIVVF